MQQWSPLRTPVYGSVNTDFPPQVLQSSDLPAGLVNIISGRRDQMTVALANHSVIKAIWYWGSAEVRAEHQHLHQCSNLHSEKRGVCRPCATVFSPALCLLANRAASTSSTPAPAPWKPCACPVQRRTEGRTGLMPPSWRTCGEVPSSGRVSGFQLHKETGGRMKEEGGGLFWRASTRRKWPSTSIFYSLISHWTSA